MRKKMTLVTSRVACGVMYLDSWLRLLGDRVIEHQDMSSDPSETAPHSIYHNVYMPILCGLDTNSP